MTTICMYCNQPENKQDRPGLVCDSCYCFVHLSCLRRPGTPGDFECDVFFNFTCAVCSPTKKELFERNRFLWVNVLLLTLHHLRMQAYGISNKGFFHYKIHICSFIDRNWVALFGKSFKQKKKWIGTIAGALSVYNNLLFHSGSSILQGSGWWRLMHHFSPAVATDIVLELSRDKKTRKSKNNLALEKGLFFHKVTEMGYADLLRSDDELTLEMESTEPAPAKKIKISDSDEGSSASCFDTFTAEHVSRNDLMAGDDSFQESNFVVVSNRDYSDMDNLLLNLEYPTANTVPPSDSSSIHSLQRLACYDSDSSSMSLHHPELLSESEEKPPTETSIQKPMKQERDKAIAPLSRENLFSKELNSIDMPWLQAKSESDADLVPLSVYEEVQLLSKVSELAPRVACPSKQAALRRFRVKLATRRMKRHKHLPLFDIDQTVKILGGYMPKEQRTSANGDRVLDRFQRSYVLDNLSGTIASSNYGTVLVPHIPPVPFQSLHSGAILKPYIRRDSDTKPLFMKLTEELLTKTNGPEFKHCPDSIQYSYVRPQHMAAINNLCEQFFWHGVDLSESLQYPEFSCVVTYKKLVVGFAFLVPSARHGEAYISFMFTRPEWRGAGIATFMLYHLLQTCTGQDVTLHVSPTNSAIFLYQKFGFKVEELFQDFYEKYFDIHHKGCRHALFLRLVR